MDSYHVFLPNVFVQNPEISGLDIAVYSYLRIYSQNMANEPIYLTAPTLAQAIFGSSKVLYVNKVKESLQHIQQEYPDVIKSVDDFFIIDKEIPTTFTLYLALDDMKKILCFQKDVRFKLLKLYCVILISANLNSPAKKYFASDCSSSWYEKCCNLTRQSLIKHFQFLEDMKLIYICRSPRKKNIIGPYQNKNIIIEWGVDHGYKKTSQDNANKNRGLTQKYHRVIKLYKNHEPIPYSCAELQEIATYIKRRNERMLYLGSLDNYECSIYSLEPLYSIIKCKQEELCETEQKAQ